ncbi:hypothetical protein [Streptomyces swartbergensis]|uniref:Uncharacterized protein n=1 Tax=Streptomyces swartbergensis TaxID=487165 RepID=A0A243RKN7_9ACTN|nr:hypothetical protein [Streptomyces swartbergensis]OUC95456.1 hypothetical protein CA983_33400 [Streptomyces swartbergensis]
MRLPTIAAAAALAGALSIGVGTTAAHAEPDPPFSTEESSILDNQGSDEGVDVVTLDDIILRPIILTWEEEG